MRDQNEDQMACMTVAELMLALEGLTPHLRVVIEGCDCLGRAKCVDPPDADGLVVIRRYHGTYGDKRREAFPYGTFAEADE